MFQRAKMVQNDTKNDTWNNADGTKVEPACKAVGTAERIGTQI